MGDMMQRTALLVIVLVIVLASCLRFWALEDSPPGVFVDEAALATHILCVQQTGADAYGVRLPLFSEALGGGLITPTYLYSGVTWTAVFGPSIASFRALIAFYAVLTILGLFILGRTLFLSTQAGLFCALAGAISPWGFHFSRIAWDPPLAPCFLVGGLVAVFTARRWVGYIAAGVLLAVAMYAYPPTRVHVVLLLPFLCYLKLREDRRHWKPLLLTGATWLLVLWPLILGTMRGKLQGRLNI
jgi:predicted membrane-bound mannosyltransferase